MHKVLFATSSRDNLPESSMRDNIDRQLFQLFRSSDKSLDVHPVVLTEPINEFFATKGFIVDDLLQIYIRMRSDEE
jgi:hypothetical protein